MEQDLVVGARVEHKEYGEGVIVQVMNDNQPYLVQFYNSHSELLNGYVSNRFSNNCMWWCADKDIKLVTPAKEQPKTKSQQLVDILVQLGFKNKYNGDYPYNYYSKKLNVWWNDFEDVVCNYCLKKNNDYISKIYNEPIATNIAYFQKKLNKKLKKAAAKQVYAASVEPVCKPHDVVIPQVEEELVNTGYFKLVPTKAFHDLVAKFKKELFNDND